jgi:hypothetical protein
MGLNGTNCAATAAALRSNRLSEFEMLESRQLMSTVNVTDYGAKPSDGNDDTAAIRAAIDDSHSGDTVYFPAGTYDVGDSITLRGDRNYRGQDQNSIIKGNAKHHLFKLHDDNVRIENFTFDGKAIFIDHANNQMVGNVVINNNTFHVHARGDNFNGITFTTGLRDSEITNNNFDRIDGDNGVHGYNWANLRIANNSFRNGEEGIHVVDFTDQSHNLTIEQNYFSNLHRMGVEVQGGGSDTLVQDNFYENPSMTSNPDDNMSTFAYSIIADHSRGTVVRRNTSIAPERPDGKGVRIIFELGGENVKCYDNYSVGGNDVAILNTSVNGVIRDNKFTGQDKGPHNYDGRSPGAKIRNNGPDVQLTWNINRGRPGPNKVLSLTGVRDGSVAIRQPGQPKLLESDSWVLMTNLHASAATNGLGPVEVNRSNGGSASGDGSTLHMDGRSYDHGLGVAGNSTVTYDLDGKYSKFFSDIGIDDDASGKGSMTFQVWGDGKKLYDSGTMKTKDGSKGVGVYVTGVKQLKLVTTNAGDGSKNDQGDWASPRLVKA